MCSEIGGRTAILSHTECEQIHRYKLLDGGIALRNAAERDPDNGRADRFAVRRKAVRSYVNEVGSDCQIGKIHEEAGNLQHLRGDIEHLPPAGFHIRSLCER